MRWLVRAAVAIVFLAIVFGIKMLLEQFVIEYVVRVLITIGINVILAVGINLINGTTGQFSIGQAGFMAIGAYACAVTVVQLENVFGRALGGLPPYLAHGLVLNAGLVVGALLAGIAGIAVGAPSLRLRGDYLAIVTLGYAEIIRLLFNNTQSLGGPTGYSGGRAIGLPAYTDFFWVVAWAALVIWLVRNLTFSSHGRALAAIREDEIAAEAVGLPTTRFKVLAFAVSAMAAGVGGGLYAHLQASVNPNDFNMNKSIDMIVMIIVGGMGSITGAVVGAAFVAITLEVMRDVQEYRLVAYALLLIVLMIVRPQGLLGTRELPLSAMFKRVFGRKTTPASAAAK